MKLLMVITDGFEDIEAIGTLAILRRAGIDVTFSCIGNTACVGRYGVVSSSMVNLSTLDVSEFDGLIIPGGPEYVAEERNPDFLRMVKYFMTNDKIVAAICAGPTIIGHLGLLNGRRYTCFTSMNEEFGGCFEDKPVVVDSNLITARSAAATIDFAFAIVEKVAGKEVEKKVKDSIYYYGNN